MVQIKVNDLFFKILVFVIVVPAVFSAVLNKLGMLSYFSYLDDMVMLIILCISIMHIFSGNLAINRVEVFFIAFIIVFFLSAFINSVRIDVMLMQARSYILPLFVLYYFSRIKIQDETFNWIFYFLSLICLILFTSAIIELLIGRPIIYSESRFGERIIFSGNFRAYSLIGNPIDFSNYMLLNLAVFFGYLKSGIFNKVMCKVMIAITLIAMFLSASRGPLIAAFFAFILYEINEGISLKKISFYIFSFLLMFLFLGERVLSRFSQISPEYFMDDQYRGLFLYKAIQILIDNPLFGVGPGKFGGWVSINYHLSEIYHEYSFTTDGISSIDMFWPHLFPEVGLIGGGILIIAFIKLYFRLKFVIFKQKNESNNHNRYKRCSYIITFFMLPSCFLIGFFSISLETQLVTSFFMIWCGISLRYLNYG